MKQYLNRIGFIDGIKPAYNPISTPKTAIWEGRNVDVDDIGVLRLKPGTKLVTTSLGLGGIQGSISAFGGLLYVWQGKLYKDNLQGTRTLIFEGLGDKVTMELWSENNQQVVYLHDGNGLWKTDGATCSRVTPYTPGAGEATNMLKNDGTSNPEKARIALFRHGMASRMVVAYKNSIYLSRSYQPNYFPSDQIIQLPDDGGTITGLDLAYGALVIYRDIDTWVFFGDDVTDPNARLVKQETVGAMGKTIANVPGLGTVFLGSDNVYALREVTAIEGQYQAQPIGDDILPYLKRAMGSEAVATYHNGEYILSFPQAIEPERVFRLKTKGGNYAWYIDDGPLANGFIKHGGRLFYTSAEQGVIGEITKTVKTDNGKAIPFMATFAHEKPSQGITKLRRVFVFVESAKTLQDLSVSLIGDGKGEIKTVNLEVSAKAGTDFSLGQSAIGVGRIGRVSEITVYEAKVRMKTAFVQVQIAGTSPDQDIAILGYALEYTPKSKLKGSKEGVTKL